MAQPWHVRILPGRGCAFIGITVFGSIVESVEQDRFVFGGQRIRLEVGMKLEEVVVVCQQKFLRWRS